MERSKCYRFTVDMKDGKPVGSNAHRLQEFRKGVSLANTIWKEQKYVKLQGRGPRAIFSEMVYGKGRRRGFDQSLPLKYATHADVYLYTRNPLWN